MDLDDLHFADESSSFADEAAFEVILLSDSTEHLNNSLIQSENRLSPCHAFLLPHKALSNIPEFVETTIVLKKDKNNELGISIVGGSDSYLEQVCVMDVQRKGVAYTDGRLRTGDVILAVNDVSLREVSLKEAARCIREATSPVRLIILRENPQALFTTHEAPTKFLTVELRKFSITDNIGISIMQRTNGRGVFVTYVQPGSIAARHGRRIAQGDQILEINGQNVRDSNQKDVAHMIQNLDGAIVLLLGRIPKLYNAIQEWMRWKAQQGLRHRASTWSAYTANTKEKLQVQRPSLPVSKESQAFGFANSIITTIICSPVVPDMPDLFSSISPCPSRTSSLRRSRSRLSMVAETINFPNEANAFEPNNSESANSENPLLPSILVTSF